MSEIINKEMKLEKILSEYSSAVIAFSGGVDSTLLGVVCKKAISSSRLVLVTVSFSALSEQELNDSVELARELGLKHKIIQINELNIPLFTENPVDRCYHCKKYIFEQIKTYAESKNIGVIFDGTNADDTEDFRPGFKALKELDIVSPLKNAGLTKQDIRDLSQKYNLSTMSKPSYACLASRIPYGEKITEKKLKRVDKCESQIRELGFSQFRVRCHNDLARLEFVEDELDKAWNTREKINNVCLTAGFKYVSIDCEGYKTGSLNRTLDKDTIEKYEVS